MNKEEFLRQLEQLLSDIPEMERREAMDYYENYFEDAGPENEMKIIEELGSPQKVAESMKRDLFGDNYQAYERMNQQRQQEELKKQQKENRTLRNILIIILLVFTSPIWIGILAGLFGIAVGILATLFALAVTAVALEGSCLLVGVVLSILGIFKMVTGFPAVGLIVLALGMAMLAVGILGLIIVVWVIGRGLPWTVRGFVRLCKKPFQKRGAAI